MTTTAVASKPKRRRKTKLNCSTRRDESICSPHRDPIDDRIDTDRDQREWLASKIAALTTSLPSVSPSEWAENDRWLPPSASNISGPYSFDVTPYLREIVDCFAAESPVREVAAMKGIQLGFSRCGENVVGYHIAHQSSTKILWYTSTNEKAVERLTSSILPMIQQSGLSHRIKSSDDDNKRRTGKTLKKLEFSGGGEFLPRGAENPANFREVSAKVIIRDEIDAWKDKVGPDGDPLVLSAGRAVSFEDSRKIFDISTPLIEGTSKIARQFKRGDQRYYYVRCLNAECGFRQVLRFKHKPNQENGIVGGLVWELSPEKKLVPGSVRYLCQRCGHAHRNEDKTRMLAPEYGAEWIPTAIPEHPSIRSYHLSSLYSPVGMQSWESIASLWLEAWDDEAARPKDLNLLQVFYNNCLGEPFTLRGERLRFVDVSEHRQSAYRLGEIPNKWAALHAGSTIQLLTCAVDVQDKDLAVGVFGWTRGKRCFVIDYERFEGPTSNLEEPTTWGRVRDLIRNKVYTADDGTQYRIALTLVDSGHETSVVYDFVGPERGAVIIKGESSTVKSVTGVPFRRIKSPLGERGFGVNVDLYKERWHLALRQGWDRMGLMPEGHFVAPTDLPDDALKELTREKRVEEIDPRTKVRRGWKWVRPGGSKNELWDTLVYASAGLDITAWKVFTQLGIEKVDWNKFWEWTESSGYFTYRPN